MRLRIIVFLATGLLTLLAIGSAGMGFREEKSAEDFLGSGPDLMSRVDAYMDALMEKDILKLAEFYSPEERKKINWDKIRDIVEYNLQLVTVSGKEGSVELEYSFYQKHSRIPILSQVLQKKKSNQKWTWTGENWYLAPQENRRIMSLAKIKEAIEERNRLESEMEGKEVGKENPSYESASQVNLFEEGNPL